MIDDRTAILKTKEMLEKLEGKKYELLTIDLCIDHFKELFQQFIMLEKVTGFISESCDLSDVKNKWALWMVWQGVGYLAGDGQKWLDHIHAADGKTEEKKQEFNEVYYKCRDKLAEIYNKYDIEKFAEENFTKQ